MDNMGPRYSFDSDPGERAPLDNTFPPSSQRHLAHERPVYDLDGRQPQYQNHDPDPSFAQLRQNRTQAGIFPSSSTQPIPPPHRDPVERTWGYEAYPNSITPGADNFSEAAGGGIPGLAMSVAERHARESGLEAMRATQQQQQQQQPPYPPVYQRTQPQNNLYADASPYAHDQGYHTPDSRMIPSGIHNSPTVNEWIQE
ncbi:hypothetical protein O1611_g9639 [Lasiodiplodia mahajangana]|uniref:Uncharacterized protein n=1 Tax=Lasiodiplodia mahajangana TaxID=1108764 RepID=A0ACC2J756_9PEZI|nr:hypothetical protein O1611_g9639 [Lasiodiplodia mahajangana]